MSDDLLVYFNRELNRLRAARQEFADGQRTIAERLSFSSDTVEDPHISRLIDAFAFLTARIQRKLDDEFPELTDSLLGVLYPHLLAPVPSMSILQIEPERDLAGCYHIDANRTVELSGASVEVCRFRTGYPLDLWPVRIDHAVLARRPSPAPQNRYAPNAVAILKLTLATTNGRTFSDLQLDRLRFHLPGEPALARALYEQIFAGTVSIAVANGPNDDNPVFLDRSHLREVGFEREEGLLPFGAGSALSYRLLTEYFSFPDKFLFFDVTGLAAKTLGQAGKTMEVYFYLNRVNDVLEPTVTVSSFALGCTPLINLFSQRAEPIKLTQHLDEYRVVADLRRQQTTEIYSIDRVTGSASGGRTASFSPFYWPEHDRQNSERRYWHPVRRYLGGDRRSEIFISLVDLAFDPGQEAGWTLSVEATCFNGDLPRQLPFGNGSPAVTLVDSGAGILSQKLLTRPTRVLRPPLGQGARWRFISHLTANHLSLAAGADALREMLRLYDVQNSAETRHIIDGILDVSAQPAIARLAGAPAGICRGLDFTLELADFLSASGDGHLLASMVERFLGLYVTLNSFTRLTAQFNGAADPFRRWPARSGSRILA